MRFPESGYRGEYIAEIARDYLARATIERDGVGVTAGGDVDDCRHRTLAVAYLRNEQDRDLAAPSARQLLSRIVAASQSKVEATVSAIVASGMTLRRWGRALAQND